MKTKPTSVFVRTTMFFLFCITLFRGTFCFAEQNASSIDWPRFRGPKGNGISDCTEWDPTRINNSLCILWKKDIGAGYANVSIKGNRLYTLGNKNKQDTIYCIHRETGDVYWEFTYSCTRKGWYPGTRATPFIDGDRLYTISREGHVFCLDTATSGVIWKKHIVKDFQAAVPTWNFSGSPVIRGNILYLTARSCGIALDKMTGKTIWQSPKGLCGYTTPVFCTIDKKDTLLMFSSTTLYAVEPLTGTVLWTYPRETDYGANTTDPLVFDDHVLVSSSYGMGSACFKVKNNTPETVWTQDKLSSHFPNFILLNGYIYGNDGTAGKGRYCCIDPLTGKILWSTSPGFGTLAATNQHLIFLTELGHITVAHIDHRAYKKIAGNRIKGGIYFTGPVLHHGLLYIRERTKFLYCIDVRKK